LTQNLNDEYVNLHVLSKKIMQQNLTIDTVTLHFKRCKVVWLGRAISINETDGIQIGNKHNINRNKDLGNV